MFEYVCLLNCTIFYRHDIGVVAERKGVAQKDANVLKLIKRLNDKVSKLDKLSKEEFSSSLKTTKENQSIRNY